MKKRLRLISVAGGLAVLALEIGLRMTGVLDFPLYQKDVEMGYIQRADQSGSFLNKNKWSLNQVHLFGDRYESDGNPSVFLTGDSVVWCGNPYAYEERLCVVLEERVGKKVWSAAAGSWSSWSEVAYMKRFPEVVARSNDLVWMFNSGDFVARTVWQSEETHPTRRPRLALLHVFKKFVLPRLWSGTPDPAVLPTVDDAQLRVVTRFIQSLAADKRKVVIVLWPSRDELLGRGSTLETYAFIAQGLFRLSSEKIRIMDLKASAAVRPEHYRDGIHPNPEGVRVLADEIVRALE